MVNRREFLKLAATMSTAFGIGNLPQPVQAALKAIDPKAIPKLIYLQGQSCTGCSISLLQAASPSPLTMITDYSQLVYHADLSAASGQIALDVIEKYLSGKAGDYFLALEGSIPAKMPEACMIGEKHLAQYLDQAAKTMSGAVAVGACACYGGIPSAEGNLTGAIGLKEYLDSIKSDKLVVNIPGCSVHPDWVWLTIVHLVKVGLPELVDGKPKLFFEKKIHELCPRYSYFQQEVFARKFGDQGCLFKLGCLGPTTNADCPNRWWNGGRTWCIGANATCIGCASPDFAKKKAFPFYRINEQNVTKEGV